MKYKQWYRTAIRNTEEWSRKWCENRYVFVVIFMSYSWKILEHGADSTHVANTLNLKTRLKFLLEMAGTDWREFGFPKYMCWFDICIVKKSEFDTSMEYSVKITTNRTKVILELPFLTFYTISPRWDFSWQLLSKSQLSMGV